MAGVGMLHVRLPTYSTTPKQHTWLEQKGTGVM